MGRNPFHQSLTMAMFAIFILIGNGYVSDVWVKTTGSDMSGDGSFNNPPGPAPLSCS